MKNIFSHPFQFSSVSHHKKSADHFHLKRCPSGLGTDPMRDPSPKGSATNYYKHFRRDVQGRSGRLALYARKLELYSEDDEVQGLQIKEEEGQQGRCHGKRML